MFGKRKARITELEAEREQVQAELEQLRDEFGRAKEALARKENEYELVLERTQKERRRHADYVAANPERDRELAREAVNYIRYGPLFDNADPAVPRYTHAQVEAGWRRIHAELGE